MKTFITGQKGKIEDFTEIKQLTVELELYANMEIDITCFGLDSNQRLADDRYMIFYNQLSSPEGAIVLQSQQNQKATFSINLDTLPSRIQYLVFAAAIDGTGVMSHINNAILSVKANGQIIIQYLLTGRDFRSEKAIIFSEIYLKDVWRFSAVGKGFDGGLAALLTHFGGEVADEVPVVPTNPTPVLVQPTSISPINQKRLNLEKKLEKQAPAILNLAKKAKVSLEKAGLQNHSAKVALCLDISASMSHLYNSGKIQGKPEL